MRLRFPCTMSARTRARARTHAHSRTRVRFLRTSLTVTNGPPWRGMLLVGEHTRRHGFSVCVYTRTQARARHTYTRRYTHGSTAVICIIRFPKNRISDERNVNIVYVYALSRVARKPETKTDREKLDLSAAQ